MINQYKSKDNTLYDIHDKRLPENLDAGKVVKVNSAGTGFEYGEAGGGTQMDLLWENARPESNFPGQTMTINGIGNYQFVKIVYCNGTFGGDPIETVVDTMDMLDAKYSGANYLMTYYDSISVAESVIYSRIFTSINMANNSFTISNSTVYSITATNRTSTSNNALLVPYKIYGIK